MRSEGKKNITATMQKLESQGHNIVQFVEAGEKPKEVAK